MNVQINRIPDRLPDNSYVVLDVELFGAEKHRLHRPTGKFACLSCATSPDDVYIYDTENIVGLLMGVLDNCVLIFHNDQFDLQHLRRWATVKPQNTWDTMYIERLLWSGYYDRFSLQDLSRRYLSHYLDKSVRETFSEAHSLSPEQIQYSAQDASTTYKVFLAQKEEVKKRKDVFKIWKEIDMPAVWAYLDFQGFRIDVDQWRELAETNDAKAQELKESFDFNPASPAQVKKALVKLGYRGLPSTGESVLDKYIRKNPDSVASKTAQAVLDYRKVAKLASTYGMNMIEKYVEDERTYKVVHSDFSVIGASNGRTSSSDPNLQNIPLRTNPEYRKPWIARPHHKLIVADWSSQEPRITAYLTQDKHLIEIFETKKDLYVEIARLVHDREIEKSDPYRDVMKTDFLAVNYGKMPTDDESQERQNRFFNYFPELAGWCDIQRKKTSYVESVMGRRFWVNMYNDAHERNNLNHPNSATAADMMKLAIVKIHQGWDFDCPFGVVAPVHDELVLDVPEEQAPEIAKFVSETMVEVGETMCKGIPFLADAKIVDCWLEAKTK